jgi:GNAT superfamily N-acetyltransferase
MTHEDIAAMARLPRFLLPPERYREGLGAAALCFGVKHGGKPVGYIWICLDRCDTAFGRFRLRPNEAYSLQTWVQEPFRRKGLAMYLKWRAFAELMKSGRDVLYSHVIVFNTPSVGFHNKLNAKMLRLGVVLQAAHRFWVCLPLKTYPLPAGVDGIRRPGGFSIGFGAIRDHGAGT